MAGMAIPTSAWSTSSEEDYASSTSSEDNASDTNTPGEGNSSSAKYQAFLDALGPVSNDQYDNRSSGMTVTSIRLSPLTDTALCPFATSGGRKLVLNSPMVLKFPKGAFPSAYREQFRGYVNDTKEWDVTVSHRTYTLDEEPSSANIRASGKLEVLQPTFGGIGGIGGQFVIRSRPLPTSGDPANPVSNSLVAGQIAAQHQASLVSAGPSIQVPTTDVQRQASPVPAETTSLVPTTPPQRQASAVPAETTSQVPTEPFINPRSIFCEASEDTEELVKLLYCDTDPGRPIIRCEVHPHAMIMQSNLNRAPRSNATATDGQRQVLGKRVERESDDTVEEHSKARRLEEELIEARRWEKEILEELEAGYAKQEAAGDNNNDLVAHGGDDGLVAHEGNEASHAEEDVAHGGDDGFVAHKENEASNAEEEAAHSGDVGLVVPKENKASYAEEEAAHGGDDGLIAHEENEASCAEEESAHGGNGLIAHKETEAAHAGDDGLVAHKENKNLDGDKVSDRVVRKENLGETEKNEVADGEKVSDRVVRKENLTETEDNKE